MQDTTDEKIKNYKSLSKSYLKQNGGCGTTAGWKTSPYVHLLLGGKPRSSCTPHSMTSRARSENKLNLCSFGLNVFPFITKLYLPTIKKTNQTLLIIMYIFCFFLCQYFILPTCGHPVVAVMSLIPGCYHCDINSWGETKSCHLVFI